ELPGYAIRFTKSRIPQEAFEPKPEDHEKYGGDPQQPHKLHLVTRIRSFIGRPYWEKEIIEKLGLQKVNHSCVGKILIQISQLFKLFFMFFRVQPLKLPYGVPTEEDLSDTYLNSRGQLIIRKKLQPADMKSIES
ncbi:hypothetical protein GDO81_005493, partial [Engystomops pustulosus]